MNLITLLYGIIELYFSSYDPTFFGNHRVVAIVENFYSILERIHSKENSHVGYKKTLAEVMN